MRQDPRPGTRAETQAARLRLAGVILPVSPRVCSQASFLRTPNTRHPP